MESTISKNEITFQNALDIFETLNQNFPSTTAANVIGKKYNEDGELKSLIVKIFFSKTNLQKFETRTHSNIYSVDVETGVSTQLNDIPIDEPVDKLIVVKTENKDQRIIIRKDTKNEKQLYLEHWDQDGLSTSLKLNNVSKIHNNNVFGGISWSKNSDKIVFIAEREEINDYSPYWDSENKKDKDFNENKEEEKKLPPSFDKFRYNHKNSNIHSNYGETLADLKYTVIVVYDLINKILTTLNLRKMKEDKKIDSDIFDDVHPAHPIFDESGNGIIFHGYHLPVDKLGLLYCINRPTKLYYIKRYEEPESSKIDQDENKNNEKENKEEQPKFKYDVNVLTRDYYFSGFAKFSDDYKYLAFFSSKEVFHTHWTSVALSVIEDLDSSDFVIETVIERDHEPNEDFSGIYGNSDEMQRWRFIKNTHSLLVSTVNKGKEISVLVDFSSKTYKIIKLPSLFDDEAFRVLLIHEDIVLFKTDLTNKRPRVILVTEITTETPKFNNVAQIDTQNKKTEKCESINDQLNSIKIDIFSLENESEGYFVRVKNKAAEEDLNFKRPTILIIHGGPHHWSLKNEFLKSRMLWLCLGYNLWFVNYRGSGGYGLKFMESLSGHVFDYDINDTLNLFSICLEKFSEEIDDTKLGVYGGSHGGYLSCSIISHPDWATKFKAACIWNPVTAMNMSTMVSDIPDWHWSVVLEKINKWHYSRDDIIEMFDKSPINRTLNVKTPSLFIIGESDIRVPKYGGLQFYRAIKENGVETELMYYPGQGHRVEGVEEGIDALMSMTKWFIDHF